MENATKKIAGFSLVELMVVLSILSVIVGLSLPKLISLKISAARAEMFTSMRTIHTLLEAYHAENGTYNDPNNTSPWPTAEFAHGYQVINGTPSYFGCGLSNYLGFALTDCEKNRYQYLMPFVSHNSVNYNISAISYEFEATNGTTYKIGNPPISPSLCKTPYISSFVTYYADFWDMDNMGTPSIRRDVSYPIDHFDAKKSCQ